ncbi:hypothetical protein K7472_09555 [Streptomyces sp. PTM05]|uniref:Uncharacterized protein n=1 Tax=Streptantibioticus parmotrematis TaxID=2873249 RepID=A0ABS7QQS2_9ACTN|nr:hypothetical protein [Streptantibioticus parmotrematis]MBY8885091.1 hypothetical protein [Streptantibioticus parmotrematis]
MAHERDDGRGQPRRHLRRHPRQRLRRRRVLRRRLSKLTLTLAGLPLLMGGIAGTVFASQDAAGPAASAHGSPARLAPTRSSPPQPNPDCTLVVPADPLTAKGLATPYRLTATDPAQGPCHEANPAQSAFVEAAVLTKSGGLTLYDPLVTDAGRRPGAPPAPATVPAGSTVGIWFGFNGTDLTLRSASGTRALTSAKCVGGLNGSLFGQFAYCDAPAFFKAAGARIAAKQLKLPALGTAKDGMPCPTTRDFSVVDQDQSDNVVTHYLADGHGRIAQNDAAGHAALPHATDLANGSDNLLLAQFVDPALGCTPPTAPDQSSDGQPSAALPLDELSAAAGQRAPVALVPLDDPMTLRGTRPSTTKTNLYRAGVGQPPLDATDHGDGAAYCRRMFGDPAGVQRVFRDRALLSAAPSADAGTAANLFAFLALRAGQSFTNLGCGALLGVPDPVTVTTDANGVATGATLAPLGGSPRPAPSASPRARHW